MTTENTKRLKQGALVVAAIYLVLVEPSPSMLIALVAVFAQLSN